MLSAGGNPLLGWQAGPENQRALLAAVKVVLLQIWQLQDVTPMACQVMWCLALHTPWQDTKQACSRASSTQAGDQLVRYQVIGQQAEEASIQVSERLAAGVHFPLPFRHLHSTPSVWSALEPPLPCS